MRADPSPPPSPPEPLFARTIAQKAKRKLRAQRAGAPPVWTGMGMSGLIGWSVAVPTLAGALAGLALDRRHPGAHSWTLMLLVAGLMLGCWNAWLWVARESESLRKNREDGDV